MDDGSSDRSLAICRESANEDERIRVFSKPNGGVADARNFGISMANGELVSFVDPDDYVDPDYIEYLFELLIKNNATIAICQHRNVYSGGKVQNNTYKGPTVINSHTAIKRLLYDDQIDTSVWAKLYLTHLFDKIQFPKGRLFEDIATTYKTFLVSERIAVGSEAKYSYSFRNNSIVNKSFSLSKLDLIDMTEQMAKEVTEVYPDLQRPCQRRILYAYISTLNQMRDLDGYQGIREKLISTIKVFRKPILKDHEAPFRDKMAVVLICFGYPVYEMAWKFYLKLKKGQKVSA
ncbi:putative glycosyl transferase [Lacticaseibacillus paracasei]|nr:glycosyltransferase [Lacticaseibacillus paracasei]EKQ05940.1 putative glycosyl transferase [Lacticaseibacillus paracasei]